MEFRVVFRDPIVDQLMKNRADNDAIVAESQQVIFVYACMHACMRECERGKVNRKMQLPQLPIVNNG